MTYEQLKTAFAARRLPTVGDDAGGAAAKLSVTDLTVAATVSKVIATIVTYPYQVVRSCMQQRSVVGDSKLRYETFGETLMHLWRVDGFYGFYRGLFAHILRSTPQASVTLLAYEYIHRAVLSVSRRRGDE